MTDRVSRWRVIEGSEAATLEAELRREMPDGHTLHAHAVHAVARRDDCDDVARGGSDPELIAFAA